MGDHLLVDELQGDRQAADSTISIAKGMQTLELIVTQRHLDQCRHLLFGIYPFLPGADAVGQWLSIGRRNKSGLFHSSTTVANAHQPLAQLPRIKAVAACSVHQNSLELRDGTQANRPPLDQFQTVKSYWSSHR
jgi:hypothetical protein